MALNKPADRSENTGAAPTAQQLAETATASAAAKPETVAVVVPAGTTTDTAPVVEPSNGVQEHAEAELAKKEKAAEAETAQAAEENRLPESGAVTNPAPATEMKSLGGAFVEPEIIAAIPVDHPAVDNNPRAGTSAVQNGADYNDPFHNTPNSPDFVGQGLDLSVYGDAGVGPLDKKSQG